MNSRQGAFCIVRFAVIKSLGLKGAEANVYSIISTFSAKGMKYYGSVRWMADALGVDRRTVFRALKSLREKNLIEKSESSGDGIPVKCWTAAAIPSETAGIESNVPDPAGEPYPEEMECFGEETSAEFDAACESVAPEIGGSHALTDEMKRRLDDARGIRREAAPESGDADAFLGEGDEDEIPDFPDSGGDAPAPSAKTVLEALGDCAEEDDADDFIAEMRGKGWKNWREAAAERREALMTWWPTLAERKAMEKAFSSGREGRANAILAYFRRSGLTARDAEEFVRANPAAASGTGDISEYLGKAVRKSPGWGSRVPQPSKRRFDDEVRFLGFSPNRETDALWRDLLSSEFRRGGRAAKWRTELKGAVWKEMQKAGG